MIIVISKIDVNWGKAFEGFLPSKYLVKSGALYTCKLYSLNFATMFTLCRVAVGILGATVMPHSLFVGSALATQDRISSGSDLEEEDILSSPGSSKVASEEELFQPPSRFQRATYAIKEYLAVSFRKPPASAYSTRAQRHEDRENKKYAHVKAHIYHGIVDIVINLLGFAVVINSLSVLVIFFCTLLGILRLILAHSILILASAVFYYRDGPNAPGDSPSGSDSPAGLFDAYDLIRERVGKGALPFISTANADD